ncbi:hypothetical protein Daus18300_012869 [Diaporthe australafricana]|uniref:Uncharacterized protein n=1 Tax=Diaporthe australafricana TaxID=127596 RepID=A0ABR3W1D9_9PEZI
MDSFAWGVFWGIEKLVQTLRLPGIPLCDQNGSSPDFEAEREKWLETSTRDWDQTSLESYLLAHIPNDKKCQALLPSCVPSLWKLVTYFSLWPFINPTPSAAISSESATRLSFGALSRAIAFLCGRHSKMFAHYNDERDADVPRREDRLALEYIFRALATDAGQETTTTPQASKSTSRSLHDDVLDTLNTVQPVMNEFTRLMNREKLFPLATRLVSSPAAPAPAASLSSLSVPTSGPGGMLQLLNLFVLLLRHAAKFDRTPTPAILVKDLSTARTELQNADGVSFDAFIKLLGDDELNVYDAVALLFNTFPCPKSLSDGIGEDGDDLLLYSLRRPGLKLVHH